MHDTLKKSDRKRGDKINQLISNKFIRAKHAGSKTKNCYMFICEGDSAMNFIISMLNGDNSIYGYIALRGVIRNYRKSSLAQIEQCEIFKLLKQVINLNNENKKQKPDYKYIVISTDYDSDGFHIAGLLINMFDKYWPELLEQTYIKQLRTSVVRLLDKKNIIQEEFYSFTQFKQKYDIETGLKGQQVYYSKGLGSNNTGYARNIFKNLD